MTTFGDDLYAKNITCTTINGGAPSIVPADNISLSGNLTLTGASSKILMAGASTELDVAIGKIEDCRTDKLRLGPSAAPASATAAGTAGDMVVVRTAATGAGFLYVALADNVWARATLTTFT